MLKTFADHLHWIAVTAWAGGLWAVGYLAAPALFSALPSDRALAGMLAGRMFTLMAYVGFGCGAYLLLFRLMRFGAECFRQIFFWGVVLMLVLTAIGFFGVQTVLVNLKEQLAQKQIVESVFKDRFATWHGVSGVLYLAQSLLGMALVLLQRKARM